MAFTPDRWLEIFAPQAPLLESIARGSLLYIAILLLIFYMVTTVFSMPQAMEVNLPEKD